VSSPIKTVVIGTFLEPELVDRIRAVDPALRVLYEPELLPTPRYKCDHTGTPLDLTSTDLNRWLEISSQADAYFDFDWFEPSKMIERAPQLQWIQATSAGIGSFMTRTRLDQSSVTVTTAGGIHAIPLSEYSLMGALHFIKGVPRLDQWKSEHHWERYTTRQLSGLRLLVIGLGGIGRQVASSFAGLGVEVWGLVREGISYNVPNVARTITRSELGATLPLIDIVVVCCPLTPETKGLLGAAELALLPEGAVLVNISRGEVIEQDALLEVLLAGKVAGACLDVFSEEPLSSDSRLWDLPNVIISPHSASTVTTENAALVELFCENLLKISNGQPPRNLYQRELGY
jgi:glyoxylate/hydroxypyruvate reductase A